MSTVSAAPKVEEYTPREEDKFTPYLFMVIHAVDYSRKDGVFATNELDFFLGRNFLVTYHAGPLRSVSLTEERAVKATTQIARAPDRVAHRGVSLQITVDAVVHGLGVRVVAERDGAADDEVKDTVAIFASRLMEA